MTSNNGLLMLREVFGSDPSSFSSTSSTFSIPYSAFLPRVKTVNFSDSMRPARKEERDLRRRPGRPEGSHWYQFKVISNIKQLYYKKDTP